MTRGLHQYLDDAQMKLNNIGAALFNAYIFQPFESPDGAHMVQQEEQQQQASGKWQVTSDKQNNSPITYHSSLFL